MKAAELTLVEATPPGSRDLFAAAGVRVTREKLITQRGEFLLAEITSASAQQRVPAIWPSVMTVLATAAVGLPLTASWVASSGETATSTAALASCAGALFFGIYRLLTSEASYCVVVSCRRGQRIAMKSSDHQLVVAVVAAIEGALAEATLR